MLGHQAAKHPSKAAAPIVDQDQSQVSPTNRARQHDNSTRAILTGTGSLQFPHPTRAMSLPRLGCGDPSQKCQDGTKCSDDHNGDHGSVLEEAVCEQDPYPDPAALADQQDSPSSGHAEAAVVHALFLPSRRTTQMQDLRKTTHDHSRSPPLKIFMMIRNSIPKSFKHWKQQPCPPQGNSSKQGQCQVLQSKDHLTPTTQ